MPGEAVKREDWRRRPWAIVLLVLLAVAFGAHLGRGGSMFWIVTTGILVVGWTALLVVNLNWKQSES